MPDALARLAQLALAGDEREILQAALRETARGVHAPLVHVLELSPDGDTLIVRASRGWGRGDRGHRDLPAGRRSQAGFTLDADAPVAVGTWPPRIASRWPRPTAGGRCAAG